MRSFGRPARVVDARTTLGEGPRWDAAGSRLLWVDIEAGDLHVFDPASGVDRAVPCGAMVGAVAPWHGDVVLAALADAVAAVDLASGRIERLVDLPGARPGLRANDCAVDPAGRFWIGTMALDQAPGAATLSRWDGVAEPVTVLTDLTISNGLAWVGDRMYFADTPTKRVDVLDYDAATGAVARRRPFVSVEASPDGLCVDDEGAVWVALHGGGEVRRYTPDGVLAGVVEVPEPTPTACTFAGSTLYVTTRSGLWALDVPFSGPPAAPFRGGEPLP